MGPSTLLDVMARTKVPSFPRNLTSVVQYIADYNTELPWLVLRVRSGRNILPYNIRSGRDNELC
jgi:hypothetical protein